MSEISLQPIEFTLRTRSLDYKIKNISPSPSGVENGETNVQAMKKFIELYEEMGTLLKEYQELLERDQKALAKVGETFLQQDINLSKIWK